MSCLSAECCLGGSESNNESGALITQILRLALSSDTIRHYQSTFSDPMCDQEYVDAGDLGCIETFINNVVASGARIEFNSFQASLAAEESSGN